MALFTESRLKTRFNNELRKGGLGNIYESNEIKARRIISESVNKQRGLSGTATTYDIFLSHSSGDAELVAGLKLELEDLGLSVYID